MKTLTYGVMHFVVAFSVSYVLTGSFATASAIAMIEPLIQTVAYFFHEKVWEQFLTKKNNASQSEIAQSHQLV